MGLINLRNALMAGKHTPTAKDYVQDGLVAMWDGIENAGWGVHDPNATTWKDLIGGSNNWEISRHGSWGDLGLGGDGAGYAAKGVTISSYSTLEACFRLNIFEAQRHILTTSKSSSYSDVIYFYMPSSTKYSFGYRNCFLRNNSAAQTLAFTTLSNSSTTLVAGYMNGVTITEYSNGDYMQAGNTTPTIFGRISGDRNAKGTMFCIRVYNRTLTAAEIAANYAVDKARFNLPTT